MLLYRKKFKKYLRPFAMKIEEETAMIRRRVSINAIISEVQCSNPQRKVELKSMFRLPPATSDSQTGDR